MRPCPVDGDVPELQGRSVDRARLEFTRRSSLQRTYVRGVEGNASIGQGGAYGVRAWGRNRSKAALASPSSPNPRRAHCRDSLVQPVSSALVVRLAEACLASRSKRVRSMPSCSAKLRPRIGNQSAHIDEPAHRSPRGPSTEVLSVNSAEFCREPDVRTWATDRTRSARRCLPSRWSRRVVSHAKGRDFPSPASRPRPV
jgi:hypothetical protein